jgi:hypothetical protein
MFASWLLGCALANDKKTDAQSGLHAGGPLAEGCYMTAKIDCPLKCADIDFDAVCNANLGADCDGTCGAEATGNCLDNCNSDCNVGCSADSSTDCKGACTDRCTNNCDKVCAGAVNPDQCKATCDGDCNSSCSEDCRKNADSSCNGNCKSSCNATCSVEAHVACQLRCSVDGFTTCKAKVAAQCVAECSSAVMLTCADPNGQKPNLDTPTPDLAKATEDSHPVSGALWVHTPEDDVTERGGIARSHANAQVTTVQPDPPTIVQAPPTDGGTINTTDVPVAPPAIH